MTQMYRGKNDDDLINKLYVHNEQSKMQNQVRIRNGEINEIWYLAFNWGPCEVSFHFLHRWTE